MPAKTHGMSGTKEYRNWHRMIRRCCDPRCEDFKVYGARGIRVCDRWMSFENFVKDMGPRPFRATLDRIDNKGPYSPENCKWKTPAEQARNTSRNVWLEFNGQKKVLQDWANKFAISSNTIRGRLKSGWSVEKALTTPVRIDVRRGNKDLVGEVHNLYEKGCTQVSIAQILEINRKTVAKILFDVPKRKITGRKPRAKITKEQVVEIRNRCDAGETYRSLESEFPISRNAISKIHKRETWADI